MRIFCIILSLFCIIATGLPLFRVSLWWVRIFDFPRVQIAVLCLVATILYSIYLGFKKKWSIAIFCLLLSAFVYQLVLIVKYTPLYPVQAKACSTEKNEDQFSIMQSNIKMDNKQAEEFKNIVYHYKPDILLINEPDKWWAGQLSELDSVYPYSVKKPLDNTYGMMLYSRLPLEDTEVNFLVKDDIPSMFATVVLPSGKTFDLHCLHPEPPKPGSPTYERDTEILLVARRVRKHEKPAIVVGDLNDVAWSYTSGLFQRYSGLLDPREGRGLYNTYNVFIPLFRYPLDHFFYSEHFGLVDLKKLDSFGSDHFPILIKLSYEPDNDHAKRMPEADSEDKQKVKEKIEEGKE